MPTTTLFGTELRPGIVLCRIFMYLILSFSVLDKLYWTLFLCGI